MRITKRLNLLCGGTTAGLVCLSWPKVTLHLLVRKGFRSWGYDSDMCGHYFGLGPLLLLVWEE